MLQPETTAAICQLQALSPVGRCKTFDASADGYGRGEGFAVLVLKRHAVHASVGEDDHELPIALLHATAINQGGRSSGLTAPHGPAQTALIRAALEKIRGYDSLECIPTLMSVHGTGTPLGDPIEVGALSVALSSGLHTSSSPASLTLISNKSCFGHTEGAAGLTGMLAAMGALHHAASPPIMHLRDINSHVSAVLENRTPGGRNTASAGHGAVHWNMPRQPGPQISSGPRDTSRIAGTSSFGMSGVNAHALLQCVEATVASYNPSHEAAVWHRRRLYTLAPVHALLQSFQRFSHGLITFTCVLSRSSLSYLWDHHLMGNPTVPAAALLEGAMAATHNISQLETTESVLLLHAVLPTPVPLPVDGVPGKHERSIVTVTCELDCRVGEVSILLMGREVAYKSKCRLCLPRDADKVGARLIARRPHTVSEVYFSSQLTSPHQDLITRLFLSQFLNIDHLSPPSDPLCCSLDSAGLPPGAAHSYGLHPALLQSVMVPTMTEVESATLTALDVALVQPGSTSGAVPASLHGDGSYAAFFVDGAPDKPAVQLHEATFAPARRHGHRNGDELISKQAAQMVYSLAWQAAVPQPSISGHAPEVTLMRGSALHAADPALAGADLSRLLAHHRERVPTNSLLMIGYGVDGQSVVTPHQAADCASAAFVSGMLKNIPYELPFMQVQLVDHDPNGALARTAGNFSIANQMASDAWQADLYGAAARGGALLRQLMVYDVDDRQYASRSFENRFWDTTATVQRTEMRLVTGGFGGLGMLTATWSADQGASGLMLLGRTGYLSASGHGSKLQDCATLLIMSKADTACTEDVAGALDFATNSSFALATVIHAAGVQSEAKILKQSPRTMRTATGPKVGAVRRFSLMTSAAPLTFSLMFSSVSSIVGNANHANYAGANAALDALAVQHCSAGKGTVAIQWGPWASVGKPSSICILIHCYRDNYCGSNCIVPW